MTVKTIENHRSNKILWLVGLLLLGFCWLTILPWDLGGYGFDLDRSWAIALHVAFANKFQFGKDFIYTYGPYGFIQVDIYHPDTYLYSFGLRSLIALAVWAGLFKILSHCTVRRDRSVWFLMPILLFFPNKAVWMEYFQFISVVLPFILYFYVGKRINSTLILTILTTALLSLTKHTYLLLGIVFVALITLDELGKLKRIPVVAPLYLFFIWLWWAIANQDLANIPAYLINSSQIISGFSRAMGIAGNVNEIILYILGVGLFLLLVGLIEWRSRRWWGILPTLGWSAIFFITYKGAFTRHDAHALQAVFNALPMVLIFTALNWSGISKSKWKLGARLKLKGSLLWGTSVLLVLIMGQVILKHYLGFGYRIYSLKAVESTMTKVALAVEVISGQTDYQKIDYANKMNVLVNNYLPAVSGTVDLYPNNIAGIFAYDLPYKPRPVFQSFSVYTGKLARLNAEHLKEDAAETILLDLQPIDRRLASFEDGLSWLEILTRYDLANIEGRYLVLQRSSRPRQYQLEPITPQLRPSF